MVLWPEHRCHGSKALWSGLVKADAFQGKRKIKDKWEDRSHKMVHQITTDIPSYKVMDQCRQSQVLHHKWLFLTASEAGIPLCVGVCQVQDSPTPVKITPMGSDSKTMPQEDGGLTSTECQARKTSLGWINGKLWHLPWTSARASTEDGWRLQVMCSGHGCLQNCMQLVER